MIKFTISNNIYKTTYSLSFKPPKYVMCSFRQWIFDKWWAEFFDIWLVWGMRICGIEIVINKYMK